MSVLAFAILAIITLTIGWKRNFFSFPSGHWFYQIRWHHVAFAFFIYFLFSVILSPWVGKWLQKILIHNHSTQSILSYATWLNFINSTMIFVFLMVVLTALPVLRKMGSREPFSYLQDLGAALTAWAISFPLIVFVNQGLDWIVTHIFHVAHAPEQLAVQFLKMTLGYPVLFILALLSIAVLAPLVEEVLFRGFLQSFIRQHLGKKQAIFITSLLFSLFHYSPEQKISNLTIVGSLFIFSLFLGFVYEKRESLLAPIFLHSLFNTVNVMNLYFLGKTL
ncbi:MAG TPA: type II CAAX endopeptidase family protein [Chlamydiales bacterium]|nr:type II CAAX endopeptidase family protein [Chlamydiales bacterium]